MKEFCTYTLFDGDLLRQVGDASRHTAKNKQMRRDHQQPVEKPRHTVRVSPGAHVQFAMIAFIAQGKAQAAKAGRFHAE